MPLADLFKHFRDPYVQAGVYSRGDNWRMKLGSLAAALSQMDRPGQLGQALAGAGAIYQKERQGALTSAFERMQEEAKQMRADELYRMQVQRAEREDEKYDYEREQDLEKKNKDFAEVMARHNALQEAGFDPGSADDASLTRDILDEYRRSQREPEKKSPSLMNLGKEGGYVFNPATGETEWHGQKGGPSRSASAGRVGDVSQEDIDAMIAMRPDAAAAIRANPKVAASQILQQAFDPPGKGRGDDARSKLEKAVENVREDDQWVKDWGKQQLAKQGVVLDPSEIGGPDLPMPTENDIMTEAARRIEVLDKFLNPPPSFATTLGGNSTTNAPRKVPLDQTRVKELMGGTKPVKAKGGESVGGTVLPSPKTSTPATGKMGLVKATPKMPEEEAKAQVKLESVLASAKLVLPEAQAAALGPVIKQMVAGGIDPEEIIAFLEEQVRQVRGPR